VYWAYLLTVVTGIVLSLVFHKGNWKEYFWWFPTDNRTSEEWGGAALERDRPLVWIHWFLWVVLATEIAATAVLKLSRNGSNLSVYNSAMLVQFMLLANYHRMVLEKRWIKATLTGVLIVFPLVWCYTQHFVFKWVAWNSHIFLLGASTTALSAIAVYVQLFMKADLVKLNKQPSFWVATGMLLFYSVNIPYLGLLNSFTLKNESLAITLKMILQALNVIMYATISYSFLCNKNIKK